MSEPTGEVVLNRNARFIPPGDVKVWTDRFGRLRLKIGEDEKYRDIHLTLAFPLSHANRMLVLRDSELAEIGIVDDYGNVDEGSRQAIEQELEKTYFMPRIVRILSAQEEMGLATFVVETDRGPRTIQVNYRHQMVVLPGGRVLINDVDANRYEVTSMANLDARSQILLDDFL